MRRGVSPLIAVLVIALTMGCLTVAPASVEPRSAEPDPTVMAATTPPPPTSTSQPTNTSDPTATAEPTATALPTVPPSTGRPATPPSATPSPAVLAWDECQFRLECATLEVPIDYDNPGDGTVELALIRHRADKPEERIGSLVMNPGGPGGSGIDWVTNAWSSFGPALTERFDIVGFDPRGIGQSDAVHCLDMRPLLGDAFPEDAAEEDAFIQLARAVTDACRRNSRDLLPFVGTDNVARDLDRLRAALGDEQLTYYGFSYGTFIGATYAEMFPGNVRALVLDGPVDPALDFAEFVNTQSAASQAELDEFLQACGQARSCAFSPDEDPEESFDALMDRFDEEPIDGVNESIALAAVYQALVVDNDAGLEALLSLAEDGIAGPMAQAGAWATDARALDGYDAVNCLDYPMPRTPEGFADVARGAAQVAPDIGAWNTYTYFNCAYWPARATRVPGPIAASGAPPILIVASTGDPSTPYDWGVSLADQLESGVLVTRRGDGHTSFHFSRCIQEIATSYLVTLATPADGTTCD